MIDGVKILCKGTDWRVWENHADLSFWSLVNMETAELSTEPAFADLDGLKFELKLKSDGSGNYNSMIKGSLHNFHNGGTGNADRFTLSDIQQTIQRLETDFGVKPDQAVLQNLEIGLNIELDGMSAKKFISNIISMPDKAVTHMSAKLPTVGRVCNRSEYNLKVYDKLKQLHDEDDGNILRVEVSAKKARYFNKYGIIVLADLAQADKMARLAKVVAQMFDDLIYYDGSIPDRLLKKSEKVRLARFCTPKYWEEMDRHKRYKKIRQFNHMMTAYGANVVKKSAVSSLRATIPELLELAQKKFDDFTASKPKIGAEKKATISPFKCRVKSSPLENENKEGKETEKEEEINTQKSKIDKPERGDGVKNKPVQNCLSCGRDISEQKDGSKYCSEKAHGRKARRCRDAGHNRKRQARRAEARKREERLLLEILSIAKADGSEIRLTIFYSDGRKVRTTAQRLRNSPPGHRRKINRVSVTGPVENGIVALTTVRAKRLIKELSKGKKNNSDAVPP